MDDYGRDKKSDLARRTSLIRGKGIIILAVTLFCGLTIGVYFGEDGWGSRLVRQISSEEAVSQQRILPDSVIGTMKLFILAGQSNMSGRGELDAAAQDPVPGAFLFGNDYRWHPLREPTDSPEGQVDRVSQDPVAGVSPARSFANVVRSTQPDQAIGIIPCAKGGSSMAEWQPSRHETTLYGSCLKRVFAVRPVGRVAGLLFFQGETDALTSETSSDTLAGTRWQNQFGQFVHQWRSDLDRLNLPVVFAQIGSLGADSSRFANWTAVQRSQSQVTLPFVRMIRTRGLPLRDAVHYTTAGYREIGRRFAREWLQLTGTNHSNLVSQDTLFLQQADRAAPSAPNQRP